MTRLQRQKLDEVSAALLEAVLKEPTPKALRSLIKSTYLDVQNVLSGDAALAEFKDGESQ